MGSGKIDTYRKRGSVIGRQNVHVLNYVKVMVTVMDIGIGCNDMTQLVNVNAILFHFYLLRLMR